MSEELRLKKLRGSGGYVMARVTDAQQSKGNLGGPDLFLAPVGRLDEGMISRHFCNTCEKEADGPPKIEFENPNEEVAENLILAEKGQYVCGACGSTIAEYREFKKRDEAAGIGSARPMGAGQAPPPPAAAAGTEAPAAQQGTAVPPAASGVSSIEGRAVYDENANRIGVAKQVGIGESQEMVLVVSRGDGTEANIPWGSIKKIGEVILLEGQGAPASGAGKCGKCGFANKEGSKFCEDCGAQL